MAADSPQVRSPVGTSAFNDFVFKRVRVDTADLSADKLEIGVQNKLPRKKTPSKALAALPANNCQMYQAVYDIYVKKLRGVIDKIADRKHKPWKDISKLCITWNVEMPTTGSEGLVELLARFRANDMTRKPI